MQITSTRQCGSMKSSCPLHILNTQSALLLCRGLTLAAAGRDAAPVSPCSQHMMRGRKPVSAPRIHRTAAARDSSESTLRRPGGGGLSPLLLRDGSQTMTQSLGVAYFQPLLVRSRVKPDGDTRCAAGSLAVFPSE